MRKSIYAALICAISICVSVLALIATDAREASANGAPIKIILTYISGVSNWGPTNATGVAEVIKKEGEVNLSVVGLPPLSGETYAGWLIDTRNNESLSVGRFNTDQSGAAKTQFVLPAEIPDKGWNLFLITAESQAQSQAPGERKSIGGYFPDSAEAKKVPSQLPKTGGDTDQNIPRLNQPAVVATPAPGSKPNSILNVGNDFTTYGVVVLAVIGLGVLTRARLRR